MKSTTLAAGSMQQRRELAEFVRAIRNRLTPADLGLPPGARRRTPGLRREEVAQLSGLSVTWYTWLEQGRDMSISAPALARLAASLRLGRAERAYLFTLAGKRDPDQRDDGSAELPAAARACADALAVPAYILDRAWTACAWNKRAERLFVGWLDGDHDRNLLRFIFTAPQARSLIRGYPERARRVVGEFRADVSDHLDDPMIRALVAELDTHPAFARLWREHSVLGRDGGARTFEHPRDGFLRFNQVTFALAGHPEFKLVVLVPG